MKSIEIKKISIFVVSIILFFSFTVKIVQALSINTHIPEKYTDVFPGERLYFEVEIKYPENPVRKDLRLNYEIIENGEVIAKAKFLKAIETQASFMDYIVIPEIAQPGMYEINVKISDYEELNEEVSSSFQVIKERGDQLRLYFFIILGVILLVGGLVVFDIVSARMKKSFWQRMF